MAAAALAVALLGLAGCSDDDANADDEPSSTMTPTASTSPTASESSTPEEPTLPEWPAAADGTGDKAARAFARYWLEMVNYAQSTGDTAPLEDLHTPECSACTSGVDQVKSDWSHGRTLRGGEYRIDHLGTRRSSEKLINIAEIRAQYSKQEKISRSGKVLEVIEPARVAYRLYLRRDGGRWVVAALEVWQ